METFLHSQVLEKEMLIWTKYFIIKHSLIIFVVKLILYLAYMMDMEMVMFPLFSRIICLKDFNLMNFLLKIQRKQSDKVFLHLFSFI